ncbi:MAG TPA: hypothetical protein VEV41_12115 [Terriglobales bacterium]|nr:hypothetical protein [Terriglobales bacterium]
MLQRADLLSMATRFDLGHGVELVRISAAYDANSRNRWYVTHGNDHVLHCRLGWIAYRSVVDSDFFFSDAESAFSFFLKVGYNGFGEAEGGESVATGT